MKSVLQEWMYVFLEIRSWISLGLNLNRTTKSPGMIVPHFPSVLAL